MRKFLITVGGVMAASALLMPISGARAETAPIPATPVGTVTAQGDPATQSGAIVVDGNGTAPGPVGGGYIGVDSNEGVVGCANGDYTGTGDNVITAIPPAGAPEAPAPGPCTPAP